MYSYAQIKRVRFKNFNDLENAILHGEIVLYFVEPYIFELKYNIKNNSIRMINFELGSVHDCWIVGQRTKEQEHSFHLESFLMFQNI